jgi:hypothetical protein
MIAWKPVAHACNLASQEAEIRRITVQSQSGQIVCETPISKIPITKRAQCEVPAFKPHNI